MKIALPALFFLLFVFSTQHQTLTLAEDVLDITGNPVVSGKLYHILSAANTSSGVELDQIDVNYCCPVSLVLGIDPKFVYFAVAGSEETGENITTDNAVTISFANPPICATSPNVSVIIHEHGYYPLMVGPPKDSVPDDGSFWIKLASGETNVYNLAFRIKNIDEHLVSAETWLGYEDVLLVELTSNEGLNIVFSPAETSDSTQIDSTKARSRRSSTYVPLIRKMIG